MPDINHVLSSSEHYRQAFEEGLTQILQHKTAGTFILACANLFQHPEFLENNKALLHEVYSYIKEYYQACKHEGRQPDDAIDDITVMNNIIQIGLDNLQAVQYREIKKSERAFLLNYNQLRSFKPARMSKAANPRLQTPFNQEGFHFDKHFLEKEIFAEGEIQGKQISLLYNKFPFVHYHALLVVDKAKHNSQFLTEAYLNYIAELQANTQQRCPEFVMAYNSLCAGASVNHLHFHAFLETIPLPLFSKQFVHNGGKQPYPATCLVFDDPENAWQAIQALHQQNTAYNLLFKDKKIYCLPRKSPEKEFEALNVALYGWSNMSGLFDMDDMNVLAKITVEQLTNSLETVSTDIEG